MKLTLLAVITRTLLKRLGVVLILVIISGGVDDAHTTRNHHMNITIRLG